MLIFSNLKCLGWEADQTREEFEAPWSLLSTTLVRIDIHVMKGTRGSRADWPSLRHSRTVQLRKITSLEFSNFGYKLEDGGCHLWVSFKQNSSESMTVA